MPAEAVAEHLTRVSTVLSEIGFRLTPPGARPGAGWGRSSQLLQWAGGLAVVALFVGTSWWLASRKRPRPLVPVSAPHVQPASFSPGDAPSSALPILHAEEIPFHLQTRRCTCGAARLSSSDVQRARYAERDMTIVIRRCNSCGREQSTYFSHPPARTARG